MIESQKPEWTTEGGEVKQPQASTMGPRPPAPWRDDHERLRDSDRP